MILHDVRSHNEIITLRKKHQAQQPWILHGFSGTEQDVKQLIGQGIYLSVGESLLHSERKIHKSFRFIDLDYLFLETDMAEIDIETIYKAVAKLLEMDIVALQKQIFNNFARLFLRVIASEAKQSRELTSLLDCFVVPPRNDAKRRQETQYGILARQNTPFDWR